MARIFLCPRFSTYLPFQSLVFQVIVTFMLTLIIDNMRGSRLEAMPRGTYIQVGSISHSLASSMGLCALGSRHWADSPRVATVTDRGHVTHPWHVEE